MHRRVRHVLFFIFVLAFAVGAPVVVLYTAGYRINPVNGHVVRTGVFSITSSPRGANIAFDGRPSDQTTPYVFNRVMPGTYVVSLTRDGYHTWSDEITVESGRTTYRNDVLMLLDAEPQVALTQADATVVPSPTTSDIAYMTRTEHAVQIWLMTLGGVPNMITEYPARANDTLSLVWNGGANQLHLTNATQNTEATFSLEGVVYDDPDNGIEVGGRWMLVDNGQAIEVHDALSSAWTALAILPLADYTVAEADERYAVLVSRDQSLVLLDLAAENPILLSVEGSVYDWNRELRRFAWSDGIEINIFNTTTKQQTFVTRQSDAIIDLAWHPNGSVLFVSTNDDITALSFTTDHGTLPTRILEDASITRFWREDTDAAVYFYGTIGDVQGIYELAVTK